MALTDLMCSSRADVLDALLERRSVRPDYEGQEAEAAFRLDGTLAALSIQWPDAIRQSRSAMRVLTVSLLFQRRPGGCARRTLGWYSHSVSVPGTLVGSIAVRFPPPVFLTVL